MSALRRTTEVIDYRDGTDPSTIRRLPGRTKYEPITLERGVTHDLDFEQWADKVWMLGAGPGKEASLETSVPGVSPPVMLRAGSIKRVASAAGKGAMVVAMVHQHRLLPA